MQYLYISMYHMVQVWCWYYNHTHTFCCCCSCVMLSYHLCNVINNCIICITFYCIALHSIYVCDGDDAIIIVVVIVGDGVIIPCKIFHFPHDIVEWNSIHETMTAMALSASPIRRSASSSWSSPLIYHRIWI